MHVLKRARVHSEENWCRCVLHPAVLPCAAEVEQLAGMLPSKAADNQAYRALAKPTTSMGMVPGYKLCRCLSENVIFF